VGCPFRKETVIVESKSFIKSLCDCVLETADRGFAGGKRGFITFEDVPPAESERLRIA
jgi:hypothetical protein